MSRWLILSLWGQPWLTLLIISSTRGLTLSGWRNLPWEDRSLISSSTLALIFSTTFCLASILKDSLLFLDVGSREAPGGTWGTGRLGRNAGWLDRIVSCQSSTFWWGNFWSRSVGGCLLSFSPPPSFFFFSLHFHNCTVVLYYCMLIICILSCSTGKEIINHG